MRADVTIADETFLHRWDPRLKLLLLLLLVVTIFSARSFIPLLFVGALQAGLLLWQPGIFVKLKRQLYFLRWLLLFTPILHLLLTPGRTLFGLRLLSYDGLLRGLMVDAQLFLALFFTLVLTLFTTPEAVAWAGARLIGPLRWLGVPVAEAGGLLLLVLHFLPQVYRQGAPLLEGTADSRRPGLSGRLRTLAILVGDVLLALIEQADGLAREMHGGHNPLRVVGDDFVWRRKDSLCLFSGLLLAVICWSL